MILETYFSFINNTKTNISTSCRWSSSELIWQYTLKKFKAKYLKVIYQSFAHRTEMPNWRYRCFFTQHNEFTDLSTHRYKSTDLYTHNYCHLPGLNIMIALRQASSVLSTFISLILETSSVSTLSNIIPTLAWCAVFLCMCRVFERTMLSLTVVERCEKLMMSSSFHPKKEIKQFHFIGLNIK